MPYKKLESVFKKFQMTLLFALINQGDWVISDKNIIFCRLKH